MEHQNRVLRGRITFHPRENGSGYDFEGQTRFDRLFVGLGGSAEPTGSGHITAADTPDLDYGRLLERAYGKGVASLSAVSRKQLVGWPGDRVKGGGALAKAIGDDGKQVVERIREWLQGDRQAANDSVDIVMRGGDLSAIVDRSEAALLAHGTFIYQRGGQLVRPVRLDSAVGDVTAVRREAGSVMLAGVRGAWLAEQMGRVQRWYRADGRTPADPAPVYARTLLERGEWRFPVLRGIVTAPTLDQLAAVLIGLACLVADFYLVVEAWRRRKASHS